MKHAAPIPLQEDLAWPYSRLERRIGFRRTRGLAVYKCLAEGCHLQCMDNPRDSAHLVFHNGSKENPSSLGRHAGGGRGNQKHDQWYFQVQEKHVFPRKWQLT